MDLRRLIQNTDCQLVRGDALTEVTALCCDSRCAGPGALFVCLPGRHTDGRQFAAQAVAAGAVAVLCAGPPPDVGAAVVETENPRRMMAVLAARLCGEPARAMTMIGVTGTKGKTTTAHLLAAILKADGRRVGLVGTNGVCWPGHRHDLNHTTPESCDLQALLRRMADDGCDTCVMEVSSLGMKFDRAAGIEFDVGVFTNLSPDHIGPGEHADFAEYLHWKAALFQQCRAGVFNIDDPWVGKIVDGVPCRVVTYGTVPGADVRADSNFTLTREGGRLGAAFTVDGVRYTVGMPGAFSVQNALAALAAAREEAQQRLDEAQQRRAQLDEKHSEAESARRALEQEAEAARSRLRVLSEMARSREGYQASVRSLMADAARDGRLGAAVTGVVAELIHVPARFETAVTMALGGALQNIVTPTAEDARYVIEYLRQKEYGRATLLPLSLLHSTPASARERALLSDAEGCFGLASELISCDAALRPVAEYLLGRTAVVEDLGAGLRLKKRTGGVFHIATLEGDIISTGGAMSGGSRQKRAPSLLGREREIKELREAVRQKEERLSELSKTCEALSRDLMLAGLQAEAFRSQLHEQELALARQKEKADIIARDRARSAGEGERLAQELRRLSDNLADAGRQREEATALERDIETGNAATREDVQRAQAELTQQRARREAASQALTEQKVRLMALQKERDAVEAAPRRLQTEHEQACRAIGRQDEAIARADGQLAAAGERIEALRQSVEQQQRAADEQQREQDRLEQARAACAASLEQARQRREQALEALRDVGERRHRQELQKSRAEMELAAMQDRMWEEYELTYENALPLRHEIAPGPAAARVRAVRDEMHAMGDVNLSSIEEYRAVAERHEALDRQCADLRRAREDLERLVAELTGTMQSEFRRQFDVIQENFGRVFAELFGGGHAELRLSDSGDVLGCDIDIIAQPPGKKLQLLSLLSGGERALTTIALLFALLQLKPPAFCILDEIESSLDEVNVSRFAEYLRSYSGKTQFILITHRKGSMEVCDALYGVSMEERGVSKVVSARFGGAAG